MTENKKGNYARFFAVFNSFLLVYFYFFIFFKFLAVLEKIFL